MTAVLMPRMQTSRAYEFMGVNPPSFRSIPPHENAALCAVTNTNGVHPVASPLASWEKR